jgi:hypothetical protein
MDDGWLLLEDTLRAVTSREWIVAWPSYNTRYRCREMLNIKAGCSKAAQKWFIPFANQEARQQGRPLRIRKDGQLIEPDGCPAGVFFISMSGDRNQANRRIDGC